MHSFENKIAVRVVAFTWFVVLLAFGLPNLALAQKIDCDNIPESAGVVPQELVDACGDNPPPNHLAADHMATEAFGWESVSDQMQSMELATPGVLTSVGGTNPSGQFIGACDFAGSDNTKVYCLDQGTPATLFTVATDGSGTTTDLGNPAPFGTESFGSLDWDETTGTMYASSTNISAGSLYTIDLDTATATRVGPTTNGLTCPIAGGFDNSGQLFVYDICNDSMYSVDKATGEATLVGPLGFDANFGQGMDFDSRDNTCYLFAFNATTFQPELRICDTTTGASTLVDVIGAVSPGGLRQLGGAGIAGEPRPATIVSTLTLPGFLILVLLLALVSVFRTRKLNPL